MKKKNLLFMLVILILSCSNDDDQGTINIIAGCGVSNVAEDLDWLREEITNRENSKEEDMKYCYIQIANFKGETIFIYEDCNPAINKISIVLNCEGTILNAVESSAPFPFADITDRQLLWKSASFECTFNL